MTSDGEAFKIATQSSHALTRTELKTIKERLVFVNVVRIYRGADYFELTPKAMGKCTSLYVILPQCLGLRIKSLFADRYKAEF